VLHSPACRPGEAITQSAIFERVDRNMIFRSAKFILLTDAAITLFSVVTSLVGARALGPAGRGDLLLITLWPLVIAMLTEFGLPNAYRYWMAKEPDRVARLFSNAVIYTLIVGGISVLVGDLLVPHLVGKRTPEVMLLVRVYMINIPAVIFLNLMRGLLEGTRRFGWAGAARFIFFVVQAVGFLGLWLTGRLTIATAAFTMILAQTASVLLATAAVWRQLRPRWRPSWAEFKTSMHYGLRDYAGGVADYATLRLDQLMLGAMASSSAMGLYVVAVRLSEVTTYAAGAAAAALMPEVAASRKGDNVEALLARTLRLTIYLNLVVLVPLWLAAPLILRTLFGSGFEPATNAFRWLLISAVVWSAGAIVIRGLQGFGHPGLTTIARFASAVVTAGALLILLPRMGITGAAIASLIGYSVLLVVALFALLHRRQLGFWQYLRPQRRDIPIAKLKALASFSVLSPRGTEG
jgi:O-antigen/teichoic acid export membrane protein